MKKQPGMKKQPDAKKEDWRQDLQDLDSQERREIIEHLAINTSTLTRWISGSSSPQNAQIVRNLANIAPKLEAALHKAFPDAFVVAVDAPETDQIPASYYEADLRTLIATAEHINWYAYCNQLYEQMVSQLDPRGAGLLIVPVYCVPPTNASSFVTKMQVQSIGYGTGPWKIKQVSQSFFLGGNSLSGAAIERGYPMFCPQDLTHIYTPHLLVATDSIKCTGAFPLMKRGNVAGILFLASAKEDFFTTTRKTLVTKYAELFAAGLQDSQFYPPSRIQLEVLAEQQEEVLQKFSSILVNFARDHQGLPLEELEERAKSVIHEYYTKEKSHA